MKTLSVIAAFVLGGLVGCGTGETHMQRLLSDTEAIDVYDVGEAVYARCESVGFDELTEPEQVLLAVLELEAEVNNGGFEQYYLNSAGEHAIFAPQALNTIGAVDFAELMTQANTAFASGTPSADRETRWNSVKALSASQRQALSALDDVWYDLGSPQDQLLSYIEQHRPDFLAP